MKQLFRKEEEQETLPIKVIQFGEGNFLRAFVDWIIEDLNKRDNYKAGVAVIQPLERGMSDVLSQQGGLYHHLLQGIENGEVIDKVQLIECVQQAINPFTNTQAYFNLTKEKALELIFSNTTEAGIVFDETDIPENGKLAQTFPGKLTQFLKHRFDHFNGSPDHGLAIIPCELIENNGKELKKAILQYIESWGLGDSFKSWILDHNQFATTLVDRIVPGYPREEIEAIKERIGYDDKLVVKSESFHLFVLEAPESVREKFPAHKNGLNVKYVDSIDPYRTQKVRILNGAHTSMVPVGLLSGFKTVKETVDDELAGGFIRKAIFEEIIETIDIPGEDPSVFASQVIGRFQNPFIRHELMSISLNSISKFNVRVLPTILDYKSKKGILPKRLVFALSCLIRFYLLDEFEKNDDEENLEFFDSLAKSGDPASEIVRKVLANSNFWGQNLLEIEGMYEMTSQFYSRLESEEIQQIIKSIQNE